MNINELKKSLSSLRKTYADIAVNKTVAVLVCDNGESDLNNIEEAARLYLESQQSPATVDGDLLPCPFCKPFRRLVHADTTVYDVPEDEDYLGAKSKRVCCGNCGCKGRKGKTREDAIRLWNTRADQRKKTSDLDYSNTTCGQPDCKIKGHSKQTVVADGMPEHFAIGYVEAMGEKWHHVITPETKCEILTQANYTRSDLCPPVDVLREVMQALEFMKNGCLIPPDGSSPTVQDYIDTSTKALALLQPFVEKPE